MNIFESLESLNVSEECFDDIMGLVEEEVKKYKSGLSDDTIDSMLAKRKEDLDKARSGYSSNEPDKKERRHKWVDKTIKKSKLQRAEQAAFLKKLQANPEGNYEGYGYRGKKNKEVIPDAKDELQRRQRKVAYQKDCAKDDSKIDFRYKG